MYDVAVIGAGPAGATFARLIGGSCSVLLVDKGSLTESANGAPGGKCCGGLLAPDAQKMLSVLGLGLPKRVLEEPQFFVVKAIDLDHGLERYYQRHYINMNRQRFDLIQEWVEGTGSFPYFTSFFDSTLTDYYCWTIPKGDCLIVGAALHPRDHAAAKFALLKGKLREHGFEFGRTVRRAGAFILRPVQTAQLCTGGKGVALLGEAAGWISPSSAEGLSYAFRSALLLAESLRGTPEGFERRYRRNTRALRWNIFLKNLKAHFIFNPGLRRLVMRSGLESMTVHEPRLPG